MTYLKYNVRDRPSKRLALALCHWSVPAKYVQVLSRHQMAARRLRASIVSAQRQMRRQQIEFRECGCIIAGK